MHLPTVPCSFRSTELLQSSKLGPVCIRGCLLLEHEARMRRDGPGLLINEVPGKPGFGERLPILPSQVACKAVPDAMLRRTRCDVAAGNPQRANGLKRQSGFLDGLRLAFVDWNFSTQEVKAEVEDRQSGLPPRNSCKHGLDLQTRKATSVSKRSMLAQLRSISEASRPSRIKDCPAQPQETCRAADWEPCLHEADGVAQRVGL